MHDYSIKGAIRFGKRALRKLMLYISQQDIESPYALVPVEKNKIVFSSYYGRSYSDNPRYISEEVLRRGYDWDIVWALCDTDAEVPPGVRKVWFGGEEHMKELASAKMWVNNVRDWPHPPKKKSQIYLQTWHGPFAVKAIEKDVEDQLSEHYVSGAKEDGDITDAILSSNQIQTDCFNRAFWLNQKTKILEFGIPRNDRLLYLKKHPETILPLRRRFAEDQFKIILYAPTFRDDYSLDGYKLNFDKVLNAFEKKTQSRCIMIVRMHPNAMQQSGNFVSFSDRIIDGTFCQEGEDLCAIADYLITDYSGILYNFVLLEKPVFLCALDLNHYQTIRRLTPFYHELPFPFSETTEQLIEKILGFNQDIYFHCVEQFFEQKPIYDRGDAAEKIVDWMRDELNRK